MSLLDPAYPHDLRRIARCIRQRFAAGWTIQQLAIEYGRPKYDIELIVGVRLRDGRKPSTRR